MDCDFCERKTGVEPATFSLEGWRSTNWATSAFFIVGNFTFAKVKIIFISCKYFLYFFSKKVGRAGFEPTKPKQLSYSQSHLATLESPQTFLKEPPEGFEPTTPRLQITCSGQLSYGGIDFKRTSLFPFCVCKYRKVFLKPQIFIAKNLNIFLIIFFLFD